MEEAAGATAASGGLARIRQRIQTRSLVGVGGLALTLLIIFLTYVRILDYWFVSDDFWYLRASQVAGGDFVLNSFDYTADGPVPEFVYRPLYPVAFLLEYKVFGLTAWQYHLTSIVLHMVNTTLVWAIARKLTRRDSVAVIAAFVFGLHPSYAAAVAWITSNVAVFAMVFSLSAFLLFLHYLDGGPRRWLCYAASFAAVLIAMLIHPESLGTMGMMVLALVLLHARSLEDLRSPRFLVPVVPHVVVALAFLGVHQYVRQHNAYQQEAFAIGWNMIRTYLGFLAYTASPVDPTVHVFLRWRALVSIGAIGAVTLWLATSKTFDVRVRALVIAWFLISIVPLSTFTLGVQSRKLYVTGAPLAILVAMSGVAFWDWLSPRLPPFRMETLDVRYIGAAVVLGLFAVGLPLRTWQVTDRPHMAEASLTDLDDATYRAMIDQIRTEHPTIPEGVRLDLTHVPWTLRIFHSLDLRMVDAVKIYYGEIWVIGVGNPNELPLPPPAGSYVVDFVCPPICGPPFPYTPPKEPAESTPGVTPP